MKIAIGGDHASATLKPSIMKEVRSMGHEVDDVGSFSEESVDYPDFATKVARRLSEGKIDRGILICGTGIGMSIVANKVPGIRAALCHDVYSAERSRKSNNAQILTMGARVIGVELAKKIVEAWLPSEFAGGRSAPKVAKINAIDERYRIARQMDGS